MLNGESTNISYDHASYPGRTLEEGRSVLQSQMNPSEPFIADDYLSPYDMKSYQYPARKDLPSQDPSASSSSLPPQQQHPHSQGRFAAAFHHLFRNRKDTNASNHHGRPVVAWDEDVNRRQHIEATMARTRPTPVPRSLEHQQSISTTLTSLGGAEDETPNASPTNNYASSSSSAVSSLLTTTPLHQAARLGEGNLIRFLLANDGDPNIKNGMARTTLHMVVGGLTKEEGRFLLEASSKSSSSSTTTTTTTISNKKMSAATVTTATDNQVGIASLTIPLELFQQMKDELLRDKNSSRETSKGSSASAAGTGKSAVKAMGRLVRSALKGKEKATTSTTPSKVGTSMSPGDALSTKANSMLSNFDQDRWNHLLTERMDSVLAVLAWYHPETGEGPSINAVDANGRTALHYAAELGRSDVCMAILSNFGAMLTIIDELGARTPCELAGANGYQELAAQLEARALLYIDPYGVDDELMANMLQMEHNRRSSNRRSSTTIGNNGDKEDRRRNQLVAPFHWFETTTLNHVGVERDQRLATTRAKLLKVTQSWDDSQSGMERLMAAAASVGMEAALDGKDEDEASNGATKKGEEEANKTPPAEVVPAAITNDPESSSADDKPSSNLQSAFSHLQEWHVERYLAHHNWSVSKAMKAFKSNPRIAFSGASIPLPSEKTTNKIETDTLEAATTLTCLICYDDEVEESDWVPLAGCVHGFCTDCLTDYLKDCASTKMAFASITCPHHECDVVLTSKEINSLLKNEPDISERIHEATHEQFVTASNDFKFCTHPGCPGVVRRLPQSFLTKHGIDDALVDYTGAVCVADPSSGQIYRDIELPLTYDGVESSVYQDCHSQVQPRQAHRFCFACGDKRHWPVTCQRLDEWRKNIQEEIGTVEGEEQGSGGGDEHTFSELAQKLWIKTNTRPCPKVRPICVFRCGRKYMYSSHSLALL
jgi:ankyrin repeat protein